MTTSPIVSFCVPTYNRARYLDSLLESLTQELAGFPFSYEVFVSDNASTDATTEVVSRFEARLPLRYVRHAENRGGPANAHYVHAHALGRYLVYVADDDAILGARVAQIVAQMEANPAIGVAYAPWKLLDLVADQDQGQFYTQDRDVLLGRGQYAELLDAVLRYRIFPEIYICRTEMLRAAMPRVQEQAFYAFVHAAEFLQHGSVLLLQEPYYVSVTNYFADHQRTQAGTQEAEMAWDRYRGGLEYILGRAAGQISAAQRAVFLPRIQDMIAERIAVAVRLRVLGRKNPVETYYLAYRLKAIGAESALPVALPLLCVQAALDFLLTDAELNRNIRQLVCWGEFPDDLTAWIRAGSALTVRFFRSAEALPPLDAETLVFARDAAASARLPADTLARFVSEPALLAKFPA